MARIEDDWPRNRHPCTYSKIQVGMKILGQGDMRDRQDEALRFALGLGILDAFTIGAENRTEQEDLIRGIAAA
jgi:hypothetical protein